jgi:hypothetical protein
MGTNRDSSAENAKNCPALTQRHEGVETAEVVYANRLHDAPHFTDVVSYWSTARGALLRRTMSPLRKVAPWLNRSSECTLASSNT